MELESAAFLPPSMTGEQAPAACPTPLCAGLVQLPDRFPAAPHSHRAPRAARGCSAGVAPGCCRVLAIARAVCSWLEYSWLSGPSGVIFYCGNPMTKSLICNFQIFTT